MQHLKSFNLRHFIAECKTAQNVDDLKNMITYMKNAPKLERKMLTVVYRAMLDIYIESGRYEESLPVIQEIIDANLIDAMVYDKLKKIKQELEAAEKEFPFGESFDIWQQKEKEQNV